MARPNSVAPTVLSLCSGYGGLDLAAELAFGARVVGYVERDSYAAAVLLARMEDSTLAPAPVWCGDLEDLDPAPFLGVDFVTAGFPCQPWSSAGKQAGTGDERWIWPAIAALIGRVGPRYVVLENVRTLISGGGLALVLGDLADLGFNAEWTVLSASAVGASQARERIFVLAYARRAERRSDDGTGGRRGEGIDGPRQKPGEPLIYGASLAHSRSTRRSEVARGTYGDESPHEGWAAGGGDLSDGGGEDVAHGDGAGLSIERQHLPGHGHALAGSHPDRCCGSVVEHADESRRQGPGCPRSDRGLFPPGPGERDEWAAVLARSPMLEPSLCRVADGPTDWLGTSHASRDDQLRLLGNGVVPLQAAVALAVLAERAGVRA